MKTNLEIELIKQNKKLYTKMEMLLIKEYEQCTEVTDNQILDRLGLNSNLKDAKKILCHQENENEKIKKFTKERIFHISQIEKICKKYSLRFLNVKYYKGKLDKQLPFRLNNFEVCYDIKMESDNSYIMAPMKSFELKSKPRDPLFFYKISDEYYYLIYKWGNDFRWYRKLLILLSNRWSIYFSVLFVILLVNLFIIAFLFNDQLSESLLPMNIFWIIVWAIIYFVSPDKGFLFINSNNWNNEWK